MAGIKRDNMKIFIVAANTAGSSLTTSDAIVGEITNWGRSGGEEDFETIYTVGGDLEKDMPRSQMELSFDVIINDASATTLDRYDTYWMGSNGESSGNAQSKAIFISNVSDAGVWKTWAFNNCKAVTWEPEFEAEDLVRGSITFKFNSLTSTGASNLKSSALSYSTSFFNWAS